MEEVFGFGWEALAVAAFLALIAMASVRASSRWRLWTLRVAVLAVAIPASVGVFRLLAEYQHAAEWRAWQTRYTSLAARALAPGSVLACLDGETGETVETACEKIIFAKPETTAAAVTYLAARLALLADGLSLADEDISGSLAGLRRMMELDRYGIAAHVLATRDGCSIEACAAFAWVEDPTALKANMKANAFDGYVQRHAALWDKNDEPPEAKAEPKVSAAPAEHPAVASPVASRWDFPSAASIPPVSIMNKEPAREGEGAPAAQAAQAAQEQQAAPPPQTPVPPRRPQTQGAAAR